MNIEKFKLLEEKLSSGEFYSSDRLCSILDVEIATLKRYIKKLKEEYNAPIEYDRKNKGYHYTQKTFVIPGKEVSEDEFESAKLVKNILETIKGTPFYERTKGFFETLSTEVKRESILKNATFQSATFQKEPLSKIVFLNAPISDFDEEVWENIFNAINKKWILKFDYLVVDNMVSKKEHFAVFPIQILFDSGDWFLWSYCFTLKKKRLFRICKIENLEIQEQHDNFDFSNDEDSDFRNVMVGKFGCFADRDLKDGELKHFKLLIYKDTIAFERTKRRVWGRNQEMNYNEEGNMILEFDSNQTEPILTWIHSWACDVEPIEPREVYEVWRDRNYALNRRIHEIERGLE